MRGVEGAGVGETMMMPQDDEPWPPVARALWSPAPSGRCCTATAALAGVRLSPAAC